jgi:hypothetical protein
MSQFDQNKKSAEGMVRDTVNRGQAVTEKTAQAAQESYSATAHGLREFNVKSSTLRERIPRRSLSLYARSP